MAAGVMPSRLAEARSISTKTCRPWSCRSLVVSASCGAWRRRSTSFGTQVLRLFVSASSRLNWYWVRLTRSSIVKSCTGCMNSSMPSTRASSGCIRRMISVACSPRSFSGLRLISMRPLFKCRVGAVHADEGGDAGDSGILQHGFRQRLLPLRHRAEGYGLRRFRDALDQAGVLRREEALGHPYIKDDGQHQGAAGDQQGRHLAVQHPVEGAAVARDHVVEEAAAGAIEAALLVHGNVPEQARAHHRRQRQRHHGGDQDRDREGDGEFAEQPADDVAHEQQRDQHRDQRERQGNDGKADLLRHPSARLPAVFPPARCSGRCSRSSRWHRPPRSRWRWSAPSA